MEVLSRYKTSHSGKPIEFAFGLVSSSASEVVLAIKLAGEDGDLVRFQVDMDTQTVSATTTSLATVSGIRRRSAGSGIAAAVPRIIECLKSSKPPKSKDFVACLKQKGIAILEDAARCAGCCMPQTPDSPENDFELVEAQALELHERWLTYCRLFESASQRELLNESASNLFALTAELYREGILASLFRLTDKVETSGQENITIRRIPEICPEIQCELQCKIEKLDEHLKPLKLRRHKLVGHTDRIQARQFGVQPVPEFEQRKMEEILSIVREILGEVRDRIKGEMDFDYDVNTDQGVEYLVRALSLEKRRGDL